MGNFTEKITKRKFWQLNPYVLVILSFVFVILLGSFLIVLPFSQTSGHWGNYMDALFSAVSATCVTGLCTYAKGIGEELTFFGQLIMLLMIQVGGLGFVTVLTFFITLFASKLQFRNRYLLSQMVGSTNFADVVKFVRKLILISAVSEIIGTLLLMPVFMNAYKGNPGQGIWVSIFTSVSAFNNAGFDLFGATSIIYENGMIGTGSAAVGVSVPLYIYMCIVIMLLIVVGGISFLVIIDIFGFKRINQWRAFTKIVLSTTGALLAFGFVAFLLTDVIFTKNGMDAFQALFQSVTLRTAGFATYNQDNLSLIGKIISCALMFIGGSPLSTAGGIKTTTAFMVLLAMYSYFRGKHVIAFKRTYSSNMIVKAMSLVFLGIGMIITALIFIAYFEMNLDVAAIGLKTDKEAAIFFEIFSAFGTVGVTTGLTPHISIGSKIVLCFLMFFGRLGPMTFLQIFQANMDKKQTIHYEYVEEDFLIG
jgi:trk system potassium uptake protein TrkH